MCKTELACGGTKEMVTPRNPRLFRLRRAVDIAIAAAISTLPLLLAASSFAGVVTITKNETLTINGEFAATPGSGLVGAIADSATTQDINFPGGTRFTPKGVGNSLNTITAQATIGDYSATGTASVGAFTQVNNQLQATATLTAKTTIPTNPPPLGGFAFAYSRVIVRGTIQPTSATNQTKITVTNPALIKQFQDNAAGSGARVYDPITVSMTDKNTGETISSSLYSNMFESQDGGTVGFNSSGNLELGISAGAPPGEIAAFDSTTDAPYATNLTGTADLENGSLATSGIFANMADWSLAYDPNEPGYVTDAVFNKSTELDSISASLPEFTSPATNASDPVALSVSFSLQAREADTPEPAALALLGIGGAALLLVRRRRRGVI